MTIEEQIAVDWDAWEIVNKVRSDLIGELDKELQAPIFSRNYINIYNLLEGISILFSVRRKAIGLDGYY